LVSFGFEIFVGDITVGVSLGFYLANIYQALGTNPMWKFFVAVWKLWPKNNKLYD